MTKEALAGFKASLVAPSQIILVRKKEVDDGRIQNLTLAFFDGCALFLLVDPFSFLLHHP
jgi:thiamine phosphate synthase YjbQ (UPF0047 family)